MIDSLLSSIAGLIVNNIWLAPLLALAAGLLTTLTPCSLSTVPLILGYVGGTGVGEVKKALLYSVVFSLGSTVTFVTFGIIAAFVGRLIDGHFHILHIILGVLMILMSFQVWGVFRIIPSANFLSRNKKRGFAGAFAAGLLAGVFSSHCSTPVLVALLAMLAEKGNMVWGILLMLLYSAGHSVPVMIAGTSAGFVRRLSCSRRYEKTAALIKGIMGGLILICGLYTLFHF